MDYEKILKRIVQIINTTENSDTGFTNICTYIGENCPELQKSEDERIRKELIDYINRLTVTPNNIDRYNSWIAWLEKQVQSTTITIPKDLKGTDTDGGVIGEKGKQGEEPQEQDGFEAELNSLLKKYEYLPKEEVADSLEFYLGVVRGEGEPKWNEEDSKMIETLTAIFEVNYPDGFYKVNPIGTIDMQGIHSIGIIKWLRSIKQRMGDKK